MIEPTKDETFRMSYNSVCGDCKGEGEVRVETIRTHNYSNERYERCKICLGSGIVTITKVTNVTVTPKNIKTCLDEINAANKG